MKKSCALNVDKLVSISYHVYAYVLPDFYIGITYEHRCSQNRLFVASLFAVLSGKPVIKHLVRILICFFNY